MAINKNHEFEELDGVKCAIVEKNVSTERVDFLKDLLEFNKYTVIVVTAAPPKAATAPATVEGTPPPVQFTIGVTDVTFNPINAIFGRLLKTPNGHIVTLAYWQQKEKFSNDEVPYFAKK
jgi:hypothetical protein